MKLAFAFLLCLLGLTALAQSRSGTTGTAEIGGIVTKDPDGEPVKKALIELIAENQAEGGNYTDLSAADGTFRIENIRPGRYRLFAERTGLLDSDRQHGRSEGRVLTLAAGQELQELHVRLQAAAVVRGRVTDEDGEALPNAEVSVLRQTFVSGHTRWEPVGAERTNDLGEYRIANLPAGNVYVSVVPPPDFKSLIEAGGVTAAETRNPPTPEKPAALSYQATYYPGTTDRGQAAPIQLHAGDDFPMNFSLTPSPSLSVQGTVVNLPPHTSASILLQSRDFNVILNGAEMHKDGSFVIRDVSPGSYTLLATLDAAPVTMTARQALQIGASNVEGLHLSLQPGAKVRGRLRQESSSRALAFDQVFLLLESLDGEQDIGLTAAAGFSNLAHVNSDGSFQWVDVPPGNYCVQIAAEDSSGKDWYVKSVLAGGRDLSDSGIAVNGATLVLDLVASANGGMADGTVTSAKGDPIANAVVVAAPETRLRGRLDRYRKTVSDQSGHFRLQGLRPGDYTLFAWESVDGEAYYSPDFLKAFEGQGSALRLGEGERKALHLEAIPESAASF